MWFLRRHRGNPSASPALFASIGNRFREDVKRFAMANDIPLIRFGKGDRKIDVVRPLLRAAERDERPGVVAVGVAQEFQNVMVGVKRSTVADKAVQFAFRKEDRRVTCFYFYVWDDDFGPGFVKFCAYFPYPGKVWVNGHEWAKRQAVKAGIAFDALSNGFASCEDPQVLQAICDRLGPNQILAFFERWLRVVPLPHRRRPGGRLLVGPVDAPGRGLSHGRLTRTSASTAWSSSPAASAARPIRICGGTRTSSAARRRRRTRR